LQKYIILIALLLGGKLFSLELPAQKIQPYTSLSDHFAISDWMKQYNRKFDQQGIVLQKEEYHALSIAVYGIMAYDEFKRSNDSIYYKHILNQYKYFCDTSKVNIFNDGKEMGLPYNFKFHDLVAPWYSGMTQGVAISFLLRYYELTKDENALIKVKQLAAFLLKDESDGGTISCTPENYCFIEEYPNSKRKRHVLNGFINAVIGIHEYLLYFPNDERAKEIHAEGYEGMLATFENYDTPTWTSYNIKGGSVTNQYMRYQLTELEHLNNIYQDERLVRQMMIWSYMAYNKFDTELKFYHYPKFQFAVPLKNSFSKGNLSPDYHAIKKEIALKIVTDSIQNSQLYKNHPLQLKSSARITELSFQYTGSISAKKLSIVGVRKEFYTITDDKENCTLLIQFKDTSLSTIKLKSKLNIKKKNIISSPSAFYTSIYDRPFFTFIKDSTIYKVKKGELYNLSYSSLNTPNITFLYKFAPNKESLSQVKWKHTAFMCEGENQILKDGFLELLICYELNENPTNFQKVDLVEVKTIKGN
jgi:hypothetical protein